MYLFSTTSSFLQASSKVCPIITCLTTQTLLLCSLQISGPVLTMATEINYSEALWTPLGAEYYDRLDRHSASASNEQIKAVTLNRLQSASRGIVCFLQSWLPDQHLKAPAQEIVSCPEA